MKLLSTINLSSFNAVFISWNTNASKRYLLFKLENLSFIFFYVPLSIIKVEILELENKYLKFWGSKTSEIESFLSFITGIKSSSLCKKKIILKGLGYKIQYDKSNNCLSFKLGYSHLISLRVPDGLQFVKIGKTYLIISGYDPSLLGNFLYRIKRLRFPDSYKGKGFWQKYEKKTLKLFKKK